MANLAKTHDAAKTITIVGQSASGKTNMLASLLFNVHSSEDLKDGRDAVLSPVFGRRDDDESKANSDGLKKHFTLMKAGKDHMLGEGSNDVRRYKCFLEYDVPSAPSAARRKWGFSRSPASTQQRIAFDIVDGRGGDIAPEVPDAELDQTALGRRERYRDALLDSSAAVICMPIQTDAYKNEVVDNFLAELQRVREKKREDPLLPRLERVAICYTMYEAEFMSFGPGAVDHVSEPDIFRKKMTGHASLSMFNGFIETNRGAGAFDLRFFPISSYGFISEGGAPNFYAYPEASGLKTRSVDPIEDYENPGLPDYQSHFPVEINDARAMSQWWPYNVGPPILFALTGRVTGPLSMTPADLGFGAPVATFS